MPRHLEHIPFPALIGDIGGTNARFAVIADPAAEAEQFPIVQTADHATIDEAIAAGVIARTGLRPRTAILALAGPIAGDRVPLTNCDWVVEPKRLIARFGLSDVILLNDFEAQSLSLPGLTGADLDPIGGGTMEPDGARLVVGPGTGLGAGALIHSRGMWIPVPGEGGHIDIAPVGDRDMELWPYIERQEGRISGETLLSGSGLLRLYRAVAALRGEAAQFDDPAAITAAGLKGEDATARETLELFAVHLGRIAGSLALVFMAYGGVYLGGGIAGRIAPILKSGGFREAFVDKYPHRALLERMATSIIAKPFAALAGIADFARAPGRFGVELHGRHWQE